MWNISRKKVAPAAHCITELHPAYFLCIFHISRDTPGGVSLHLCRSIQHVFDEDTVAGGGVVNQDVGDGADMFSCCGAR